MESTKPFWTVRGVDRDGVAIYGVFPADDEAAALMRAGELFTPQSVKPFAGAAVERRAERVESWRCPVCSELHTTCNDAESCCSCSDCGAPQREVLDVCCESCRNERDRLADVAFEEREPVVLTTREGIFALGAPWPVAYFADLDEFLEEARNTIESDGDGENIVDILRRWRLVPCEDREPVKVDVESIIEDHLPNSPSGYDVPQGLRNIASLLEEEIEEMGHNVKPDDKRRVDLEGTFPTIFGGDK